ncbi:winged helix DNA-binding protein [Halomonas beimenensis]|uniref:Putative transcription regulator, contains HTH domain (MarR family) n=1 Tax=Halomonas beimenensis TaxID=475662 RepID=A0A291P7A4_9GAMM|nr:winged helix DNA-binding protein [Halomonas beimenensis]ATJ82731.1 putative transcription regulator, contains HTH domain (MarR family) [Halomonas beimenensis]
MSQDETQTAASPRGPIVSSEHLSRNAQELSEFEFGMIIASHAFQRWMVRCMTAAGLPELGSLDVLVLHSINHRERAKRQADICLVLNVEDTHTVTYALKKLGKLGLVEGEKHGKETFYRTTDQGRATCQRYAEIREACLVDSLSTLGIEREDLHRIAASLRAMSGLYDQAARSAASL